MGRDDRAEVTHRHTASDIRGGRFPEGMLPSATATARGSVELATSAETITGTDDTRATTPAGVKAVLENDTSTWTAVEFAEGYVDQGAGYECQVRKIGKVVYARGLFKPTTGNFAAGTTIGTVLTVPVGFRPSGQPNLFFPAFAGAAEMYTAGLLLSPDGIMGLRTGPISTPAYISLSGLNWLVD